MMVIIFLVRPWASWRTSLLKVADAEIWDDARGWQKQIASLSDLLLELGQHHAAIRCPLACYSYHLGSYHMKRPLARKAVIIQTFCSPGYIADELQCNDQSPEKGAESGIYSVPVTLIFIDEALMS